MKRIANDFTKAKLPTVLVACLVFSAMCTVPQATTVAQSAGAASSNPFAGRYCGYLVGRNQGSMSISETGDVSGYFSFFFPTYSESFQFSGRVSADGVMRLKVVHSFTVRGRRGRASERYSLRITVALDGSGNLTATSGAGFVLPRCQ
jgi:hypothetical protein